MASFLEVFQTSKGRRRPAPAFSVLRVKLCRNLGLVGTGGSDGVDLRCRLGERGGDRVGAHADALDADDLDVGHAQEGEHATQIRDGVVHLHRGALRIDAAGSEHDINLLAGDETLRAVRAIGEGLARTGDVVDPRLQRRGDVEVDEAGGEDDRVSRKQLFKHGVGHADHLGLALAARLGGRVDAGRIVGVDMRQWVGDEVAHDQLGRRVGGKQFLRQIGGDTSRVRSSAARAGGNKQNRHGGVPLGLDLNFSANMGLPFYLENWYNFHGIHL
ncbi:conserved hypothetical protein [Mesorhizobium sp. ORS 3324]|nr:conserved hypothetical protein [Mesorhizobium sp. ORS 3324]